MFPAANSVSKGTRPLAIAALQHLAASSSLASYVAAGRAVAIPASRQVPGVLFRVHGGHGFASLEGQARGFSSRYGCGWVPS
jgi:hypothetical protein